jgi:vanillate O-demethylase ferredoxin subunit
MDIIDWLEVTVARRWREAVDIEAFELVEASGGLLPAFDAGSHVDVLTPGGHLRPYSLCNSPSEQHRYVIAVLRERGGRGGSIAMHVRVRVGDRMRIRAPRNDFLLDTGAAYSVLLGGGVGIAPLLGMADTLWRRGAGFELHYVARNAARAAFADALYACGHAAKVRCHWSEEHGRFDFPRLLRRIPGMSHMYLCGPPSFMDAAVGSATKLGWPLERLHLEAFAPTRSFAS